jgi:hypothetical protein
LKIYLRFLALHLPTDYGHRASLERGILFAMTMVGQVSFVLHNFGIHRDGAAAFEA